MCPRKYEQPDHGEDATEEVGRGKALKAKSYFKNAPMLKVRLLQVALYRRCTDKGFAK